MLVTVESAGVLAVDPFVQGLLDRGAIVVRGGLDTSSTQSDHLHHFPLRAAVTPRCGQLVGVELSDYLLTWRPGSLADLHVLPFVDNDAELDLSGLPLLKASGEVRALNIGFHLDPATPARSLAEIDRLATRCCERFLSPDGIAVFTNVDRLDGKVGSADLLVIYDGAEASG